MMEKTEIANTADLKNLELVLKQDLSDTKVELIKYINDSAWKTIGTLATFQTVIIGIFGFVQYMVK